MKFVILVCPDPERLDALSAQEFAAKMRECLAHADELKRRGTLLDTQMLEPVRSAKTVRRREGKLLVSDGPFTESKEVLGGFNLIEAASLEDALAIAAAFPWTEFGSVEVRPILPVEEMRSRVGL